MTRPIEDRIAEWRETDSMADAVELLCDAEDELRAIRAELKRLSDANRELLAIDSGSLRWDETGIYAKVRSNVHGMFAAAFQDLLADHKAVNYLEARFTGERGEILVHVQRVEGQTPHQMRAEAEARLRDADREWYRKLEAADAEVARLQALINTPQTGDFVEAVKLEAAHQRERWGAEHDEGKEPHDWFWLLGYLAGKALAKPEKRLHHIVSSAAALLNWHRHETGEATEMRPGIAPPELRRFVRNEPNGEICAVCGKHIRHHFGGTENRCDPKD